MENDVVLEASRCAARKQAGCVIALKKMLRLLIARRYFGRSGRVECTVPSAGCYVVHLICVSLVHGVRSVRHAVRLVRAVKRRGSWRCRVYIPRRIRGDRWRCYVHVMEGVCV